MAILNKNGLKVLKIVHLFTACCWLGGAVSMLTLNLNNGAAVSEGMLYGINTASHLVDNWVVVVLGALGCVFTGLLFGLLTPWGFFRHHWVRVKWAITAFCMLSGTFFLGEWEADMLEVSGTLGNAALTDAAYLAVKAKHLGLSLVQIALLLVMVSLSVFKPRGKKAR